LWNIRAASLLMAGILAFDVYGMALMLPHQSGAKPVEDYASLACERRMWIRRRPGRRSSLTLRAHSRAAHRRAAHFCIQKGPRAPLRGAHTSNQDNSLMPPGCVPGNDVWHADTGAQSRRAAVRQGSRARQIREI